MERDILVYGHNKSEETGFPNESDMEDYIGGGIFSDESGRYRYSQQKKADIIVLSRDGSAHGHFEISKKVSPTPEDFGFKQVYLVSKAVRYANKVRLAEVGVTNYKFGKYLDEQKFNAILSLAGECQEFFPGVDVPA
jgi:hypothetical protein